MMREEIRSCPFCGEYASLYYDALDHHYFIRCSRCYCALKAGHRDENIAIKEWNTRAIDKPFICKCPDNNETARTVTKVNDYFFKCPRCGGLIVAQPTSNDIKHAQGTCCSGHPNCIHKPQELIKEDNEWMNAPMGRQQPPVNNKLEPLDYEKIVKFYNYWNGGKELSAFLSNFILAICSKFGHKPIKYPEKINLKVLVKEPEIKIVEVLAWNQAIDEFRKLND